MGQVVALNGASGQSIFDYGAGASVWVTPAIRSDGSLVTADRSGRVLLFAP